MSTENQNKNNYDIASISRKDQETRANYVQDALLIGKRQKPTGQFVRVFADIFLKHEAGKGCYF